MMEKLYTSEKPVHVVFSTEDNLPLNDPKATGGTKSVCFTLSHPPSSAEFDVLLKSQRRSRALKNARWFRGAFCREHSNDPISDIFHDKTLIDVFFYSSEMVMVVSAKTHIPPTLSKFTKYCCTEVDSYLMCGLMEAPLLCSCRTHGDPKCSS